MKLATLVVSSILGISSVAAAQPAIDFHAHASFGLGFGTATHRPYPYVIRDHRVQRPVYRPEPARVYVPAPVARPLAWVNLGTVSTGKQTVKPASGARFDSLVLDITGTVDLNQVTVIFEGGQNQIVRFRRIYDARMASPVIDLAGSDRAIARVIVYTADDQRGEVTVFGRNDMMRPAAEPYSRWAKLGSLATGKQSLELAGLGAFDHLALTATGRVQLRKLLIQFADGQDQILMFDAVLTAGTRAPVIDLAGYNRRIKRVIVYSTDDQRGELTLYAM